jgi:hypothetical protein
MAEVGSSTVINDIPEELKGYRKALLNAAFSQVMTPEYLRGQIPEAQFWTPPNQPQQNPQQSPYPTQQTQNTNYNTPIPVASLMGVGDSADAIQQFLERANRVGYAQGGLAQAAEAIEKMLAGGDVSLGASGTPLGGYTPPMVVNPLPNIPLQIGTGTQTPPTPQPPAVTPPANNGGVINTPPSGTLPVGPQHPQPGQPNPMPGQPQPRPGGSSTMPMFVGNQPNNFAGASQARQGGFNPAQYADESVAQQLASQMGGNVVYTNTGGPIGPPSQAMVDAGGDNMHNAGLIDDINRRFADDEGMRQFALNNLRDEIRSYGGSTGGFAKGGIVKMADGGLTQPMFPGAAQTNPFASPTTHQASAPYNGNTGPAQTGVSQFQSIPNQISLTGVGNTSGTNSPTPAGMQTGALNPYQEYSAQRILGMGNQGQVAPNGDLQSSDLTRNALAGYGQMPSYFNNGEIDAGRGADGRATTPLGIANDTFDTAGNLAINASQLAQDMTWRNPLQSTFSTTLGQIANDPTMFQAGDISLGQLTAPQLTDPLGVSGSQLTSYQMAGPQMIDASGAGVNAGTVSTGRFIDPGTPEAYTSPYMRQVLDVQKQRANQDFAEAKAGRSAAAIKAGAFGGSRQAVADSIADRDNQLLLSQIEAQGNQSAYENAQQQFERDRNASLNTQQFNVSSKLQGDLANQGIGLQAQLANQNALMGANQQNLAAALGVQELGANQSLQAQLANQNAGLTAGQANLGAALQTQNLSRNSGLTAAQSNQQTRLSQNTTILDALAKADQLQQQATQGNVSNQLGALNQQTNSALAANSIGQNRADLGRLAQAQELLRLQSMGTAGAGVDARTQAALDLGYQDWTNQQNYPYQQMNWLQSMLSGTPMGYNQEGVQFQKTNPLSQIAGLGTAALGAYSSYKNQ